MQEINAVFILFSVERATEVDMCGGLLQHLFTERRIICLQGQEMFAFWGANQQIGSTSPKFATGALSFVAFVEILRFPSHLLCLENDHGDARC